MTVLGNAIPTASTAVLRAITHPLQPARMLGAAVLLITLATLYCQIWCLVAFQLTPQMPMPIEASVAWSFGVVVPWLTCFELCKRGREMAKSPALRAVLVLLIFVAAGFFSVVLELGLDQLLDGRATRPLAFQIAAQLPPAMLTGGLLLIAAFLREQRIDAQQTESRNALGQLLAREAEIEWIEAAGNYVEAHGGGRVTLHRVTMREVERALDPASFARIHRSVIVKAAQVEARVLDGGTPAVRLKSGKTFRLGSRYGSALYPGAE